MIRRLASVEARLLALVLLASVPLFGVAVSIAWRNYHMLAERPRREAGLVLTAMAARHEAVLDQAARLLDGISHLPAARGAAGDCDGQFEQVRRLFGDRYELLAALDRAGHARCRSADATASAQADAATAALLETARRSGRFTIGAAAGGRRGAAPTLAVAMAFGGSSADAGFVLAVLQVDWLGLPRLPGVAASQGRSWLIGPEPRGVVQVSGPAETPIAAAAGGSAAVQPAPGDLDAARRVAATGPRIVGGDLGQPFAYAASSLRGGAVLLVAVPAAADIAAAEALLGRRLAELALLLLGGLVLVALGGRVLLVQPVTALSRAVRSWRDGGPFDPGPLDRAPVELVELAATFGQASKALRAREAELRAAVTRQDLLMQEIHHRVKNNLQIVASLLNLQASRIRLPEARAEFAAARDRIRALATLHRHLYAHDELHTINMRSFLGELCDQLLHALGETPAGGRIRLDIDATELQISSDQAVPIALIVTEAVSNAAKYAFPGGRSGHIWVRLARLPDAVPSESGEAAVPARVRLSIEDDGVGIPAGRAETETGVRDGIGMTLIRGFARQLGAVLTVRHDGGTQYDLDIPLRPAEAERGDPGHLED